MTRRRPRDPRQHTLLLPLIGGGKAPLSARFEDGWLAELRAAIRAAADAYGVAQIAAWAGSSPRTVENWLEGRHVPGLEAAVALAAHLPDVARILIAAMTPPALRAREAG